MKKLKGILIKLGAAISLLIMLSLSVNLFIGAGYVSQVTGNTVYTHYSWNPGGTIYLTITKGSGALTDTATTTLHIVNSKVDSITTITTNDTSWLFSNSTNYPLLYVEYKQTVGTRKGYYKINFDAPISYIRFIYNSADSTLHTQYPGNLGYVDLSITRTDTLATIAPQRVLQLGNKGKIALSVLGIRP